MFFYQNNVYYISSEIVATLFAFSERFYFKLKNIKQISQDSDPLPHQGLDQTTKSSLFDSLINKKGFLFFNTLFISILILGTPLSAKAGVFSFVSDLFASNITAEKNIPNSQNMALLQATVGSDPNNPTKKEEDVTIVNGTALLPETGPSGTIADIDERSSSDQISIYIVRKGDTITQIAKMFDVSPNTIIWANDLGGNKTLKEGQNLVILPISGVKYTVKSGDTLKKIADRYKGDVEEIMQFNNFSAGAKLAEGDVIIIPDGEITATVTKPKTSTKIATGTNGPSYEGYYIRPLAKGRISQGLHGHNGIDFAAPTGTPIFASASGEVLISRESGWNGGYGGYIVIKHNNGTQTLYSHNSNNIVSAGERVAQGQVIGYVGSTGKSTGSHVHFEVRGAKNPFR